MQRARTRVAIDNPVPMANQLVLYRRWLLVAVLAMLLNGALPAHAASRDAVNPDVTSGAGN